MEFSRDSFNAITNWLTDVRTLASPNIVIILCGNKRDLGDEQRQVTFIEGSQFAQENGRIAARKGNTEVNAVCRSDVFRNIGDDERERG